MNTTTNQNAANNAKVSNMNIAEQHYDAMVAAAERAKDWHNNAYRKATDELYVLLADCSKIVANVRKSDTGVMRQLNQILRDNDIKFNDGTKLETKVVRVVFGDIGKRAHNYARVLVIAAEEKVALDALADWIEEQGGVEAVRKRQNGVSPAVLKAERVEKAETALKSTQPLELNDAPKVDGSDYTLAMVRHGADGVEIVAFCKNLTLIKAALSNVSDNAVAEAEAARNAAENSDKRRALNEMGKVTEPAETLAA
jgi:hypothetical protein